MRELLKTEHLSVSFFTKAGEVEAVREVSLTVEEGEVLAIVGESGCGKSALCKSIMKLLPKTAKIKSGKILADGIDITDYTQRNMSRLRGDLFSMIFQDPMTSLNPTMTIGKQIEEAVRIHNKKMPKKQVKKKVLELMQLVEIDEPEVRISQYPHEFSGGMRQRAVMAIALAGNPKILFADEPTTALDVTIQAQILDLIRSLQKELNMTVVYITHDLGVVANVADRVAVMYAGQIVEYGMVEEIFYDAWHPYTWALLSALPQLGVKGEALPTIDGTPPNLFNEVKGDAFAPRNKRALAIDFVEEPPFFEVSPTHKAKTWYLDPRAPKIEQPDSIRRLREKMKLKERG